MDRRGFLRFLGMGVAAAVAPTKAYSFLGGILRPRTPQYDFEWGPFDFNTNKHSGKIIAVEWFIDNVEQPIENLEVRDGVIHLTHVTVPPTAMSYIHWVEA